MLKEFHKYLDDYELNQSSQKFLLEDCIAFLSFQVCIAFVFIRFCNFAILSKEIISYLADFTIIETYAGGYFKIITKI